MNLLIEARNARSHYRECLAASNELKDTYDRLCRESLWVSPDKYRAYQEGISAAYPAYIKARNAAIEAEQAYNLAVAALLDGDDD